MNASHKRTISLCAESFIIPEDEKEAIEAKEQYYGFLYDSCYGKKCLIFTNSRGKAEEVILNMKNIAKKRNERDIFYVYHGSISAVLRQEAEQAFRAVWQTDREITNDVCECMRNYSQKSI